MVRGVRLSAHRKAAAGPVVAGVGVFLLGMSLPSPVHAQEPALRSGAIAAATPRIRAPRTRAELWLSLRQQKALEVQSSGDGLASRVVGVVGHVVGKAGEINLKPFFHGGHQDNSPAVGVRYERHALGRDVVRLKMPNRIDLSAEATTSADGHNEVEVELGIHRVFALPVRAEVVAGMERHPHDSFFGLGPESDRQDRSSYRFTQFRAGTGLAWDVTAALRLEGGGAILRVDTGPGGGAGEPSLEVTFDETGLPAFDDSASYVRAHALARLDWRDSEELPHKGGAVIVKAERFEEISAARFDFTRYRAEVQHYIPFFHEQRVIVTRAVAVFTDVSQGGKVPFYFMPTLGHGDALRGFDSFRFRDRHALLLQGEYRWAAWEGLEMALFLDAGKVFSDLHSLRLRDLETGYGIGFRVQGPEGIVLRLDVARSRERIRPHLSFRHVF